MDGTAWHRAGPAPTRALEMRESWPEAADLTSVTGQRFCPSLRRLDAAGPGCESPF